MRLGFTGSREGMTPHQVDGVMNFITEYENNITEVHHGDCVGADEEFDALCIAHLPNAKRCIHPPRDPKLRAWCQATGATTYEPAEYHMRNRTIVKMSDRLLCTPRRQQGGGTWYTIYYAREWGVPAHIFFPDGQEEVWG